MKKTIIRNLFSLDEHVKLYIEIINSNLDCSPELRARYVRLLENELTWFVRLHPNALMSDICRMFGDPYEQSGKVFQMVEQIHARELRRRNILFMIVVSVLVVLLVIAIGISAYMFFEHGSYFNVS